MGRTLRKRAIGLLLTAAMLAAALLAAPPQELMAAVKSFESRGTSTVSISETGSYSVTGKVTYIRIEPSVTGYITIKAQNARGDGLYSRGYWTFCDSKKKALGQADESWKTKPGTTAADYTRTYGVKKNTVYFLAVKSYGGVKLTATVKAVAKDTNSSMATAKTLSEGKKAKGLLVAGEGRTDWFRISLSSKSRLVLSYTAKTNGSALKKKPGIKITFCKADGTVYGTFADGTSYDRMDIRNSSKAVRICYMKAGSDKELKIAAGIYYVKVERANAASSGYYTLKWEKY